MILKKANAVEEEAIWAAWLDHLHNQSIYVTEGKTVMSLSASLLETVSVSWIIYTSQHDFAVK